MEKNLKYSIYLPKWLLAITVIVTLTLAGTIYLAALKSHMTILISVIAFILLAIIFFLGYQLMLFQKQQYNENYNSEVEKYALLQYFENLIKNANDIILLIDEHLNILEANDRALEKYNYNREEMFIFPSEKLFAGESEISHQNFFTIITQTGNFIGEALHVNSNGEVFPVEISARSFVIEERTFIQAIIRDITERKNNEKVLKNREKLLKAQNEEYLALNKENQRILEEITDKNLKLELLNDKLTVSENRFRSFMDNFPGSALIKDAETKLIFANKSFEKQLNKSFENLVGKTESDLALNYNINNNSDSNIPFTQDFKESVNEIEGIFQPDSIYLVSRFLIPQSKENPLLGEIILDITESRKMEKELLKLKRAVEQSPISILITDVEGNIEYINPKFTEVTGYMPNEVIGKNPRILKSNESTNDYISLWQTIKSKNDWKGIFHNKKKNGELFWENASISPILDKDGQIIHFIALKEDISSKILAEKELKENQEKLKKQYEEYQLLYKELQQSYSKIQVINNELIIAKNKAIESDKLKSAFLANLSHEIRTPMNGIIGFSEMLALDNLSTEKRKHYTEVIINSTNQLLSIVNDILDLSKIETGQITLNREQIKINKLLVELFSFFKPKADSKGLELSIIKGLPDIDAIVVSDKLRISQIFSNLIGNALKFTKNGTIEFGYQLVYDELQFYVKDTGIGIPTENQHRLFGRFQQANSEISRNYGGTGLGLAISKSLVELLGGRIWFTSTYCQGSTFYFSIPFSKQFNGIENVNNSMLKKSIDTLKPVTILLAEDEEINYIFIKEVFNEHPIKLIHTENGIETLQYVREHDNVDLILMDIKMPLKDGLETTLEIRNFNTEIPIIALSAYAMKEDKQAALDSGCNDYLSKPVRASELLECVIKYTVSVKSETLKSI